MSVAEQRKPAAATAPPPVSTTSACDAAPIDPHTRTLIEAPIAQTLVQLTRPHVPIMTAQAAVRPFETYFAAQLGTDAVGKALVSSPVMLQLASFIRCQVAISSGIYRRCRCETSACWACSPSSVMQ